MCVNIPVVEIIMQNIPDILSSPIVDAGG